MRDYHILTPHVYGGDPNCIHDWIAIIPARKWTKGDVPGPNSKINVHRSVAENRPGEETNLCSKCGAWLGNLGKEPSATMFVDHLCSILDIAKQKLRLDGTLWVNIGDSWASSGGAGGDWSKGKRANEPKWSAAKNKASFDVPARCMVGIPERFFIEMITKHGWILRMSHPWVKPSPMPNSQKNRDSMDHEQIYFFVKSNKPVYYTNKKTLKSQKESPLGTKGIEGVDWDWGTCSKCKGKGYTGGRETVALDSFDATQPQDVPKRKQCPRCKGAKIVKISNWEGHSYYYKRQLEQLANPTAKGRPFGGNKKAGGDNATYSGNEYNAKNIPGKNSRATWVFDTAKYTGNHHASFPWELPARCIKRGAPEYICKKCGLPRHPVIEILSDKEGNETVNDIGLSDCGCNAGYARAIVLDFFMGRGTTAIAARDLNRDYVGIELNPDYIKQIKENLGAGQQTRLF